MRFKERNDLANRCKEWMKNQLENNITTPLDTVHMVLAYLDMNGYLNKVVHGEWILNDDQVYECKDCGYVPSFDGYTYYNFCPNCGARMDERRDDEQIH